jgi:hypothetical protein
MPRQLKVTGPDGKPYKMTVPDDATDDEINEAARSVTGVGSDYPVAKGAPVQADPEDALLADVGTGVAELGKGVAEGGANVLDHAADWVQSGLNAAGQAVAGSNWGDALNGGKTNDLAGAVSPAPEGYGGLRGIGRFAGEAAATAPLLALPGGAFTQGAAGGALLSDEHSVLGVGKDALIGGGASRLGELGLQALGEIVAPQVSGDVRTLINAGVQPTTGQVAGSAEAGARSAGRGQVKRFEDVAASVPLAGAAVRGAQSRATESLNRAAVNRTLGPIGEDLPQNVALGHDAVAYAGNRLSAAYNDVLPRLSGRLDQAFSTRVQAIRQRANLPPEYDAMLDQAQQELGNAFTRAGPNGQFSGRTLRDASERLTDLATGWRASDDPYTRMVGDATEQYRQQLHALARRQNPADAARLRDIDRGYASLVRVERAARGTNDGLFTARQYDSAVRGGDRSARRRQSARGQALDQDLSGAASRVMGDTAAQGGSKDVNSLVALGLLGGRALGGDPLAMGGIAAVGAGSAAYTGAGQDVLRGLMTRQAGPVSRGVGDLLRYGARGAPVLAASGVESSR